MKNSRKIYISIITIVIIISISTIFANALSINIKYTDTYNRHERILSIKKEAEQVPEKPKNEIPKVEQPKEEAPKVPEQPIIEEISKEPTYTNAILKIAPANNAKNVLITNKNLTITFKEGFKVVDDYKAKIKFQNKEGVNKTCNITLEDNVIKIKTINNLALGMTYKLTLAQGIAINEEANEISEEYTSTYTACSNIYGIKDIDKSWAKKEILSLLEKGFVNAYQDRTFKPESSIKRCEFIKLIIGIIEEKIGEISITGKYTSHWAGEYIEKAEKLNIISDDFLNTNKFDKDLTRLELSILLAKADLYLKGQLDTYLKQLEEYKNIGVNSVEKLQNLKATYSKVFNDTTGLAYEGYTLILHVYGEGYMQGYADGTFKPNNEITRAEACVVITRLIKNII